MARGADAKERRKEARKEAREKEKEIIEDEVSNDFDLDLDPAFPTPQTRVEIEEEDATGEEELIKVATKKKKRKKTKAVGGSTPQETPVSSSGGIKTLPLVMLIMLTGTTLLPALLYAGDWFGGFMQKNHILGSLGHKLNVGSSPKKRVLSFYEKHDPEKLNEVDTILSKYYGDYPKLIKRLERKYGDYGYFMNWEQDEAPSKLAFEKIDETKKAIQKEFNKRAPQSIKTAARNISYNLSTLYKKGRVVWKKQIWPILEPVFGVPDEKKAKAQKRKDSAEAKKKKKGKKRAKDEYRDDEM